MKRPWIIAGLLVMASGAFAGVCALRASSARTAAFDASVRLAATTRDAEELVRLRAGSQAVSLGPRPSEDAFAEIRRVLTVAGVPSSRLRSVQPAGERALRSGSLEVQHREQSVRLTLEPVSLAEVGAFLTNWREASPQWAPSTIELASRSRSNEAEGRYTATITLSALYAEQAD